MVGIGLDVYVIALIDHVEFSGARVQDEFRFRGRGVQDDVGGEASQVQGGWLAAYALIARGRAYPRAGVSG
ncbi:MAG: hypothetical protein WD873_04250 [Candidatus Hydrogenedentales bacterium]